MKQSPIYPCILVLCYLFTITGCTALNLQRNAIAPYTPTPPAARQLETPEAAITMFVAGLAQQDIDRMVQASAIEEMSANFDFAGQVAYLRAMMLLQSPAPSNDPFYVAINQAQARAQLLNQVKIFTIGLLSGLTIDGNPILNVEQEDAQQFVAMVDPSRLTGLTLVTVALPNEELMQSERYLENSNRRAAIYGAEAMTERVVLLAFEDRYYYIGFTLFQFVNGWKISSMNSPLGDTNAIGAPIPTTPDEFTAQFQ